MIVAVDGACPSNGTGQAVKSACGVYLGPGADNWSWGVADTPGERHTSSRAELHAAIGALKAIMPFTRNGGQMDCEHPGGPCLARHVVIKSDRPTSSTPSPRTSASGAPTGGRRPRRRR